MHAAVPVSWYYPGTKLKNFNVLGSSLVLDETSLLSQDCPNDADVKQIRSLKHIFR